MTRPATTAGNLWFQYYPEFAELCLILFRLIRTWLKGADAVIALFVCLLQMVPVVQRCCRNLVRSVTQKAESGEEVDTKV